MKYYNEKFIRVLCEKINLSEKEIYSRLNVSIDEDIEFRKLLLSTNIVTEAEFLQILSEYLEIPVMTEIPELPQDFLRDFNAIVPYRYVNRYLFVPGKIENQTIQFAIVDPIPTNLIAEISGKFNMDYDLAISSETAVLNAIQRNYGREDTTGQAAEAFNDDYEFKDLKELSIESSEDLLSSEDEEPIKKVVNSVLYQATKQNASDIHIDPMPEYTMIRNRIDGVLREATRIPKHGHLPIINRLKVMASLDISIKNKPQDGRFVIRIGGRKIDIRVSTLPTVHGERAVLRLLLQGHGLMKLEELGLSKGMLTRISEFTDYPNGIILVVGPTGSGKSTTLYAILQQFDASLRNIITIEDPVEYNLQGLGQIQVNNKVGLTFAAGLRSILRQDPDVIMVGEIRDQDTSKIAIQASLTGHLVLSTLHTNDSPSTIVRLIDMGIEAYLVSSTVRAVISQRLVRKICRNCIQKKELDWESLRRMHIPEFLESKYQGYVYEGKGCDKCFNTGYSGRIGIYEFMPINENVKHVIKEGTTGDEVRSVAMENNMIPLIMDGFDRVVSAQTTLEEIVRVVFIEK